MIGRREAKQELVKMILVGDTGVGKTVFSKKMHSSTYKYSGYKPTIGADFCTFESPSGYIIQLWDTAGQEKYQSLGVAFYRGTDIFIYLYDVHSRPTFDHLDNHIQNTKQHRDDDDGERVDIIIGVKDIGSSYNNSDRKVSVEDAESYASMKKCMYMEIFINDEFNRNEIMSKLEEAILKLKLMK